jgi:hypothetical protein
MYYETQGFRNLICFRPEGGGRAAREIPTLLGPLKSANLNHWTWR